MIIEKGICMFQRMQQTCKITAVILGCLVPLRNEVYAVAVVEVVITNDSSRRCFETLNALIKKQVLLY